MISWSTGLPQIHLLLEALMVERFCYFAAFLIYRQLHGVRVASTQGAFVQGRVELRMQCGGNNFLPGLMPFHAEANDQEVRGQARHEIW